MTVVDCSRSRVTGDGQTLTQALILRAGPWRNKSRRDVSKNGPPLPDTMRVIEGMGMSRIAAGRRPALPCSNSGRVSLCVSDRIPVYIWTLVKSTRCESEHRGGSTDQELFSFYLFIFFPRHRSASHPSMLVVYISTVQRETT